MFLTSQCQMVSFIYCCETVNYEEMTTWSRVPLETLTVAQHINELSILMKPENSLLCPQNSAIGP
jgi:hypothetical protein